MKRKCTAFLTLLIFAAGVLLPNASAVAEAATSTPKSYTAYDATPNLGSVKGTVDGMKMLRLKDGSDAGMQVYSLNMSRQLSSAAYTNVSSGTNQDWAALVDKAASPSTLRQDILNVIWNGYPHFSGTWKGVSSDFSKLGAATKLNAAEVAQLNNTAVTQQAIWTLTDGRIVDGTSKNEVNALLAAAKKNPAPSNFGLDLYTVSGNKSVANLVTVTSAQQKPVSIKVTHHWEDAKGQPLTGVTTPAVAFALYPADPAEDAQPIATYNLNDASGVVVFTLQDDDKDYVLLPVLSGDTEGFTVGKAQSFSLKGDSGSMISLDFTTTYTAPDPEEKPDPATVNLGAELTFNGSAPGDGSFTVQLKDSAGNILQSKSNVSGNVKFDPLTFEKEGTYNYTISMKIGDDTATVYDKTVYNVKVVVTKDNDGNLVANVTYDKNSVIYTGIPIFQITKPTTPTTNTVSVTVNKIWKNDKQSYRPNSVTVQLYRDGKAYSSAVTLNSSNGWKYTWSNLDKSYKWTVDEPTVPSGYTKSTKNSGNTWTITNTGKTTTTTGTNKVTTTKPKVTTPTVKTTAKTSNDRSTPETGDTSHNHLLGTVAIISLSGMVLIAAVWLIGRRRLHDRD